MCAQKTDAKYARNNKEHDPWSSREHDVTTQNDVIIGSDVIKMAGEVTSSERPPGSATSPSTLSYTASASSVILVLSLTLSSSLLCGRSSGRITRLVRPSVCLSVPFPYLLLTRKQKKTKIGARDRPSPPDRSKRCDNFQFKRSTIKLIGRQKKSENNARHEKVFTCG